MEEDSKKSSQFKVLDRRRIDERGEDREDSAPTGTESGVDASERLEAAGRIGSSEELENKEFQRPQPALGSSDEIDVREDTQEVNFSAFIMSLATQALMQLGHLQPPAGVDLAVDRQGASQTIDIISMLQKKTKGNLDTEEQRLVDEIVHSLRLQFVQKVAK